MTSIHCNINGVWRTVTSAYIRNASGVWRHGRQGQRTWQLASAVQSATSNNTWVVPVGVFRIFATGSGGGGNGGVGGNASPVGSDQSRLPTGGGGGGGGSTANNVSINVTPGQILNITFSRNVNDDDGVRIQGLLTLLRGQNGVAGERAPSSGITRARGGAGGQGRGGGRNGGAGGQGHYDRGPRGSAGTAGTGGHDGLANGGRGALGASAQGGATQEGRELGRPQFLTITW